ncbi:MAG: GntR family transcriptional regulator [Planctomycetota bacterium]|nr:GntR family transcriptional regulator [Planctomycetota bacterium]
MSELGTGQLLIDKDAAAHRYHQVKASIRRWIKQQDLQPGWKVESIAKLARRFQVSKTTVAKATSELIDEGVLYSEVGSGTYVADPEGKKVQTISLVLHSSHYISYPYFSQVISGIGAVTDAEHYKLQIITSARALHTLNEKPPYQLAGERKWTDGLIIMDNCMADSDVIRFAEEFPVVLVNRKVIGTDIACVRPDDRGGVYRAVSYLAGRGHKRIGMAIQSRDIQVDQEKLGGYQTALRDHGLEADASLIVEHGPNYDNLSRDLDFLLALPAPPTAICLSDDTPAFHFRQMLRERGIRAPQDIELMGFGGCLSGILHKQPLTTMWLPLPELGQAAAELLLAIINKQEIQRREIIFKPELIVGQ